MLEFTFEAYPVSPTGLCLNSSDPDYDSKYNRGGQAPIVVKVATVWQV